MSECQRATALVAPWQRQRQQEWHGPTAVSYARCHPKRAPTHLCSLDALYLASTSLAEGVATRLGFVAAMDAVAAAVRRAASAPGLSSPARSLRQYHCPDRRAAQHYVVLDSSQAGAGCIEAGSLYSSLAAPYATLARTRTPGAHTSADNVTRQTPWLQFISLTSWIVAALGAKAARTRRARSP